MKIPEYQQQVKEAPLPDLRVRDAGIGKALEASTGVAESFAKAAGSIGDAATKIEKVQQEEKDKANDAWAKDYDAKTLRLYNELLHNDKDGLYTTQLGEAAVGAKDRYLEKYSAQLNDLDATATNEEQKAIAARIRYKRETDLDEAAMKHEFVQTAEVEKEKTKANIEAYKNDAALNYMQPGRVEDAINKQIAAITSYNARNGVPYEATKADIAKLKSETRKNVVERMLANGQDQLAEAYYKQTQPDYIADHAAGLEKALELGSLRGQSQRVTDRIMSKYTSYEAAMDAVKEQTSSNPKLRDAVTERVEREFKMLELVDKNKTEQTFNNVWNGLTQTKSLGPFVSDVAKLPPTMQRALEQREKMLNNPGPRTNDIAVYTKYMGLEGKIKDVPESEINGLATKLDQAHHDKIIQRWATARAAAKGDKKKEYQLTEGLSDETMILNSLRAEGKLNAADTRADAFKGNSQKAAIYNEREKEIKDAFALAEEQKGKKLTYKEKQEIVDRHTIQSVKVKKSFLGLDFLAKDKNIPLKDLSPEDAREVVVPDSERKKIEEALNARRMPITEDIIRSLYLRKKMK